MKIRSRFLLACIILCGFFCYEKKLSKSVEYSSGAWNESRTQFIFLRWERDFHRPKGIAKFPDGGIPQYLRDEKFICVYSRDSGKVHTISEGRGTPRGYPPSVRFSWKGDTALYKIWSADPEENRGNPVVKINMKTLETDEFSDAGDMPELSPGGRRIATVKDNSLWIMNSDGTGSIRVSDPGRLELIFPVWNEPYEIDLHVRDEGKFAVYTLNLKDKKLSRSRKPYLKNFGNESTDEALKLTR